LSWLPVVRFSDLTPFSISSAPRSDELSGYSVYRATFPIGAVWTDVADLSTATLSWTDLASSPTYYYQVVAGNNSGGSVPSIILTYGSGSAYAVSPDDQSFFQIMAPNVGQIAGNHQSENSAYLITVSSHPQDLGTLNGRVMASLEFDSYQGGQMLTPGFSLANPGVLSMHYTVSTSSLVVPSGVVQTPTNLSVYWYNGRTWVQLYGTLDTVSQTMTIQTEFFGKYQLRSVERTGGFAFNVAGVSNRFITPNGDSKNDNVVFTFDNPRDSAVVGKIFDMRGHVVVSNLPAGPVSNSLMWDGTANGRPVPGGVYIYQIQSEGQTYNGTLVIIK
jgi:gliding motility-associated-like protein